LFYASSQYKTGEEPKGNRSKGWVAQHWTYVADISWGLKQQVASLAAFGTAEPLY
jgi:hypothetical protein